MKHFLQISFLALAALTACTSKQNNETPLPTPAENLLVRIDTLMNHGIMYGHQDDPFYGITWMWDRNDRSDTKELVGSYPAVMGFDLGGLEENHTANLDSVPFEWIRTEAVRQYERGGIITFSWHPRNPITNTSSGQKFPEGSAWDISDTTVVKSILPGGEKHEMFVGWMDKVTDFLCSLKTTDGQQVPFILRPWHEYNGSWFWWGQKLCSDEEFTGLWNMFQDHVNNATVCNSCKKGGNECCKKSSNECCEKGGSEKLGNYIVWSFSPNLDGMWTDERFAQRYPGNDRVDLLGCDAYQWGSEAAFTMGLTNDLDFLSAFAQKNGKPLAMTECGKQNSTIPDWFSRVFFPVVDNYRLSYFLLWRNWHQEHFGASKDAPTADDFKQLAADKRMMLLNDIH